MTTLSRRRVRLGYALLVAAYFLVQIYRGSPAAVKSFLEAELGLSSLQYSQLSAAFFYAYAAMQLPAGILLDLRGPGRVARGGLAVLAAAGLLHALSPGYPLLFLSRLLMGLGAGVLFLALLKFQGSHFSDSAFSAATGLSTCLGNLGGTVAQAPFLALAALLSWRGAFLTLSAVTALLALATALTLRPSAPPDARTILTSVGRGDHTPPPGPALPEGAASQAAPSSTAPTAPSAAPAVPHAVPSAVSTASQAAPFLTAPSAAPTSPAAPSIAPAACHAVPSAMQAAAPQAAASLPPERSPERSHNGGDSQPSGAPLSGSSTSVSSVLHGLRQVLRTPGIYLPLTVNLTAQGIFVSGTTWGLSYLTEVYGLAPLRAGTITGLLPLVAAASTLLAGQLAGRFPPRRVGLGFCLLLCLTLAVPALWPSAPLPAAGAAVVLLGASAFYSIHFGVARKLCPPELSGVATGFVNMGTFLGAAVFPVLFGLPLENAAPAIGYQTGFRFLLLTALAMTALECLLPAPAPKTA